MFQLCACHSDTPQYNSSETFRNVPLLLSHVCPAALSFDGYFFPHRSTCPKGEHPYQKTEDGKTVLCLLLVENAQQMPMVFVCSVYD